MEVTSVPRMYDVSLPIREDMVVYPGNPSPRIRRYASIPEKTTNESTLPLGSHTGSHVDSPLHIRNGAPGVDSLPLESFVGRCKVLDLTQAGEEPGRFSELLEEYVAALRLPLAGAQRNVAGFIATG